MEETGHVKVNVNNATASAGKSSGARNNRRRQRSALVGNSDHIIRERLRRDDMSEKFSNLEKLLPWRPKRDRTAIVEDAINFVSDMQKRLLSLQHRLQSRRQCRPPPLLPPPPLPLPPVNPAPSSPKNAAKDLDIRVTVAEETRDVFIGINCAAANCDVSNQQQQSFMTTVAAALEDLDMDVCHCSLCNSSSHIFCALVAKPRATSYPTSVEDVVSALRCRIIPMET